MSHGIIVGEAKTFYKYMLYKLSKVRPSIKQPMASKDNKKLTQFNILKKCIVKLEQINGEFIGRK